MWLLTHDLVKPSRQTPYSDRGGAEIAGPENVGPQKNNDWKLQHLENDGPNRSPGICKTWKMTDQISPLEFARPGK